LFDSLSTFFAAVFFAGFSSSETLTFAGFSATGG
jgi:hypothetical protein